MWLQYDNEYIYISPYWQLRMIPYDSWQYLDIVDNVLYPFMDIADITQI